MRGRALIWAVLLALALVLIDQLTKQWALQALADKDMPLLADALGFHLIFNSGAAFSLGDRITWVFTLIALAVCLGLPLLLKRASSRLQCVALVFIWAGAAGNLIDRLVRAPGFGVGHVVDFIRYGSLFVGNVADIELVVGIVLLLLAEYAGDRKIASDAVSPAAELAAQKAATAESAAVTAESATGEFAAALSIAASDTRSNATPAATSDTDPAPAPASAPAPAAKAQHE